ncbi:translation initiation factor IF-3 [Methylophilaceae bacterium]|nr:translation initiation factor IF-3 [Methylophilaceae bacterium]
MALDKDVRINSDIIAQEIRLVGLEAEPLGIVSISEAMAKADELDTDLVEIAPKANPPVCRLMDYGKFKYAQSKKMHEAKTKQKNVQVKEIKFRPGTDENDYNIKLRNLIKFLGDGDKTKVTLRFRGREIAHQELGMAMLKRVQADLEEIGVVEQFPKMEGRQMVMVLAPNKKPKPKSKPKVLDENSAEATDKSSELLKE